MGLLDNALLIYSQYQITLCGLSLSDSGSQLFYHIVLYNGICICDLVCQTNIFLANSMVNLDHSESMGKYEGGQRSGPGQA